MLTSVAQLSCYLLFFLRGVQVMASSSCPTGFAAISNSSDCYKFLSTPLTWFDAEKKCNTMGAHLVSINSSTKQINVLNELILANGYSSGSVWLGANDISSEGTWEWTDGALFSYNNSTWIDYDFSNCMALFIYDGSWYKYSCEVELPFVCQYSIADIGQVVSSPGRLYLRGNFYTFYLHISSSLSPLQDVSKWLHIFL